VTSSLNVPTGNAPQASGRRRYFYLKLGQGNASAKTWLSNKSPWGMPCALVFFDNLTEAHYANGAGHPSVLKFRLCAEPSSRSNTVFVVIGREWVWLIAPAGPVRIEGEIEVGPDRLTPKVMPVTILKKTARRDVPAVLASIGCNQRSTRNTFTEIDHCGDLKAIDTVLGWPRTGEHWTGEQGPAQVLECLSSTGLETLVARIMEAQGCFVPAFVGGTMADVDIFAENDGSQVARLGNFQLPPGTRAGVQVKMWNAPKTKPDGVDCVVGLDAVESDFAVGAQGLLNEAMKHSAVEKWLRRALAWLPSEYLRAALHQ
jgi:hypothetical protein